MVMCRLSLLSAEQRRARFRAARSPLWTGLHRDGIRLRWRRLLSRSTQSPLKSRGYAANTSDARRQSRLWCSAMAGTTPFRSSTFRRAACSYKERSVLQKATASKSNCCPASDWPRRSCGRSAAASEPSSRRRSPPTIRALSRSRVARPIPIANKPQTWGATSLTQRNCGSLG